MHDSVYGPSGRHIQQFDTRQTNDTEDVKGMKKRKRKARKTTTGKEREREKEKKRKKEEKTKGMWRRNYKILTKTEEQTIPCLVGLS